jgi:carbon-monoxide dehydrogenase medium subunit
MKPGHFTYHAPRNADEAVAMLAELSPQDGRVIAGGQSLVPAMALRLAMPAHLVDISGVAEFSRLAVEGDELVIGAGVTHAMFEGNAVPGVLGRLLAGVVHHIGHYPIRTRGTFCGSIANADPASEWCLVANCLGATMVARSVRGTRRIAATDFFQGMLATALAPDELLVEVRLPTLETDTRWGFYEFSRRAGDFAVAMALVTCQLVYGEVSAPRIAVGGVEDRPRRIEQAEAVFASRAPTAEIFQVVAETAAHAVEPIDEKIELADYKRDVTSAVVRRALDAAEQRI